MLEKKIKLKRAIENNEPRNVVRELFLDYDEAYKRLRHPSKEHEKDRIDLYFKYNDYLKGKNA